MKKLKMHFKIKALKDVLFLVKPKIQKNKSVMTKLIVNMKLAISLKKNKLKMQKSKHNS
jgi:hypothetical protein